MPENTKIYIAGHTGMLGSALAQYYENRQEYRVITATRPELDLTDGNAVHTFITKNQPDIVIGSAGRVGGILANSKYPADFIYDNLMIGANLIHAAWKCGVKRLLNFGSSCMYPKLCPQPMTPDMLLGGRLEKTSEPYALSKLAGVSMVDSFNKQYNTDFINAIPANIYGPEKSFDEEYSHVVPSIIRKFHGAKIEGKKEVVLWGSGNVSRDFLYVEDAVHACAILLEKHHGSHPVNISPGSFTTIKELAKTVADVTGFSGEIVWDTSRSDGSKQKNLDTTIIKQMGWEPKVSIKEGVRKTYEWHLQHHLKGES